MNEQHVEIVSPSGAVIESGSIAYYREGGITNLETYAEELARDNGYPFVKLLYTGEIVADIMVFRAPLLQAEIHNRATIEWLRSRSFTTTKG